MNRLRLAVLVSLASVLVASSASAQVLDADPSHVPRVNLISANPIGLIFEWYNGEIEHALTPTSSVAVAASRFDFDSDNYTSVDGIVRYYPTGKAIRGLSVGASAGFVAIGSNCNLCSNNSATAFTIGVRGDYVWILGRDQRFAVASGIGAKRLFRNDFGADGLPIARLSIGWAW
ncbi:MAG: hypothetical protein Q7S20_03860 [Gemmatimonadaceae bacterium]|nr:hypothetical protein [Gemmatimonadaceae bacterium]